MSSEITLFQEFNTQENSTVKYILQLDCYQGLPLEAIDRLEGYVADAKRIVNKASFDLAEKFCDARDVYRHNKHGGFEGWIEERFKITRQTAYNMIWRYEQFGNVENLDQLNIALTAQYHLAQPATPQEARDEAIERAETGEKITVRVSDEIIDRYKAEAEQLKQELEEERRQHSLFKDEVETNEQAHTTLVQDLEQKLEEKPEPVKVVEYQDTLETAAKVATLEQQIKELEDKPDIPPEKQQELDNLQQELTNAKTQLDFYTTQNEALAREINEHREAVGRSLEDATALAGRLRIRQVWQYATDEIQAAIRKFHARVPSEIDRESFEGEENTRTAQTIDLLIETAMLLKKTLLGADGTVDADISTTAIVQHQPAIPGPTISADYDELFDQYKQYVKGFPDEKLWWRAPNNGIMDMEMDRDDHITYTRGLLKSGDPYRIRCAIEGMKRTLGFPAQE